MSAFERRIPNHMLQAILSVRPHMSKPIPGRSIPHKILLGFLTALLVLTVVIVSWLSYGLYVAGQAERNLHATLFTISLVERFVATSGRWPRSWEELEQVAISNAAPDPLTNETTALRIGGAHGYDWPAASSEIQRRVFVDFNADMMMVANQRPVTFEAIRPIGPRYEYRDYGYVESLQTTIRSAARRIPPVGR